MRADKDSIDYQVNLVALQEMEEAVPMTLRERRCLRKWVYKGNEVESNSWNYMDSGRNAPELPAGFPHQIWLFQRSVGLLERL